VGSNKSRSFQPPPGSVKDNALSSISRKSESSSIFALIGIVGAMCYISRNDCGSDENGSHIGTGPASVNSNRRTRKRGKSVRFVLPALNGCGTFFCSV
jgi:hypothetical protein